MMLAVAVIWEWRARGISLSTREALLLDATVPQKQLTQDFRIPLEGTLFFNTIASPANADKTREGPSVRLPTRAILFQGCAALRISLDAERIRR